MKQSSKTDEAVKIAMGQFLAAELEMAKTLTHIANTADDLSKKARCVSLARKAYDAVQNFLPRTALNESENGATRKSAD